MLIPRIEHLLIVWVSDPADYILGTGPRPAYSELRHTVYVWVILSPMGDISHHYIYGQTTYPR